jgi:large subunit ribosomal protein L17
MRHRVDGRLFGRTANQRKALLKGLVTSLLEHERIETTEAKAKEVRRIAEKIITLGLKGDLHAKRLAFSYLSDRASVAKLFSEIAPRFAGRNGGYLRIIQTRNRVNDSAPMAVLEFIDYEDTRKIKGSKEKKSEKKVSEKPSS